MMCYEIMQFFLHYVKIISLSRKDLTHGRSNALSGSNFC